MNITALSILNLHKLNAKDMFNDYIKIKDKWETIIRNNMDEITHGECIVSIHINKKYDSSITPIVVYRNTNDIGIYIYLLNKLFPHLYACSSIRYKNNELHIDFDIMSGDLLLNIFTVYGINNFNMLMQFLITYVKRFVYEFSKNRITYNAELSLNCDTQNPLSLFRCATIFNIKMQCALGISRDDFKNNMKGVDNVYNDEMIMFMLFEKFTENCNMSNMLEVSSPSPIYILLYTNLGFTMEYIPISSNLNGCRFYIESKDNSLTNIIDSVNKIMEMNVGK